MTTESRTSLNIKCSSVCSGVGYGVPQQYTQNPSMLPYMPLIMVPHNDSMGPINFNAVPSVDRTGSDLPHNGNVLYSLFKVPRDLS